MLRQFEPKNFGRTLCVVAAFAVGLFTIATAAYSQTGYGQVTLVNKTSVTFDLYSNGNYSCRALAGLMCTSQEKAGAISLLGKGSDGSTAKTDIHLNNGDSFTWTIVE